MDGIKKLAVLLMVLVGTTLIFAQQQNPPDPALQAKMVTDLEAGFIQNLSAVLGQVSADHTLLGTVNTNEAATQAQLTAVATSQQNDETTLSSHTAALASDATQLNTQAGQITSLEASVAAIPVYPKQIVYQTFLGQTAAVPATTLATPAGTAAYTMTLIVDCTGSGQVFAHISLGSSFAINSQPSCPNAGLSNSGSLVVPSGTAVNFSSTISGTPTYDARVSIVRLGPN